MKKIISILFICACIICITDTGLVKANEVTEKSEIIRVEKAISGISTEDSIYYTIGDKIGDRKLIREDNDGTEKILVKKVRDFKVFENQIYYRTISSNSLYRINADGTGKIRVSTGVSKVHMLKDGYLYYQGTNGCLYRIDKDGNNKSRLVRRGYSNTYALTEDRIYYTVNRIVDNRTGTEYSYVKSKAYDGSDVKTELKKQSGWSYVLTDGTNVVAFRSNPHKYSERKWYFLNDGIWLMKSAEELEGKQLFSEYFFSDSDNKIYAVKNNYDAEDDYENAVYSVDMSGNSKREFDLEKKGIRPAELIYAKRIGSYYVIHSANDQSYNGIYVFNSRKKLVAEVDLRCLGEDGVYDYRIVDDTLYVRLQDVKNGWIFRYYIYSLK